MDLIKISFTVTPSDPAAELGFEAWINNQCFFNTDHLTQAETITYELDDNNSTDNRLKFVLKNKKIEHTQLDLAGDIIKDAVINISNIMFDEIEVNHNMQEQMIYTHNFNGADQTSANKFYGTMGCNGTVELTFSTPVYLWLLEHM